MPAGDKPKDGAVKKKKKPAADAGGADSSPEKPGGKPKKPKKKPEGGGGDSPPKESPPKKKGGKKPGGKGAGKTLPEATGEPSATPPVAGKTPPGATPPSATPPPGRTPPGGTPGQGPPPPGSVPPSTPGVPGAPGASYVPGAPGAPTGGATGAPPEQYEETINPPPSKIANYLKRKRADRQHPDGPLPNDPRTGLPLIRAEGLGTAASHFIGPDKLLGQGQSQILLHLFETVRVTAPDGTSEIRFILVTDQTILVCNTEGQAEQSMQVDEIRNLLVGRGAIDKTLAINGPQSPFRHDLHLTFLEDKDTSRAQDPHNTPKTRLVKTLFAIYKRMHKGQNLDIQYADRPDQVNPAGFALVSAMPEGQKIVNQRTEQHLLVALKNFEKQEEETIKWVEYMQNELETEHADRISEKDVIINGLREELEDSRHRSQAQNDEIARLQRIHRIAVGLDEDIATEGMDEKDKRIYEMQKTIIALSEKERQMQERLNRETMGGNFFERDLGDEVKPQKTRPRGGSLSVQGLTEVLTRQLQDRDDDLRDMQGQIEEMEKLRRDLKDKDALISALRTQAASAGGVGVPETLYNEAPRFDHPEHDLYDPYGPGSGYGSTQIGNFFGPEAGAHDYHEGGRGAPMGHPDTDAYYPQPEDYGMDDIHVEFPEFQAKPYESILPPGNNPADMTRHPITGLPLLKENKFKGLDGVVLHMFAEVNKVERNGATAPRVLLVTDANVYRCMSEGIINRCSPISNISAMYYNSGNQLGLKMKKDNDYDMMYEFLGGPRERDECMRIIETIQRKHKRNEAPAPRILDQHFKSKLQFKRPQSYEFRLHPTTSIDRLYQQAQILDKQRQAQHEAEEAKRYEDYQQQREHHIAGQRELIAAGHQEQAAQYAAQMQYAQQAEQYDHGPGLADPSTRHALEALKTDLRREFQSKKDAEYQRLRDQIAQLEVEYEDKTKELQEVRNHWKQHRCYKEKRPNVPARHTEGMYWIPTEPTVIECQLEVLKVQFWDNILITSHANGFLNVWDMDTVELIRTLKDHTAKVAAFQYDGVELISGSYDSTIRRWNVTDGSCINVITAHRGHVTCLQFDRNILVSGSSDSTIQVWQMDVELRRIRTLRGHKNAVECLKFQRDVLVSAESGWLFLWNLEQGTVARAFRDEEGGITCLDFSDQWILTGGYAGALTMWSMTGEYETVHGHSDDISHIQLEGAYAVTSSADCTIRMWDLVNFKSLGVFNNSYPYECTSFQFIANRFVAVEQKTVKIWTK